MLLLSADVILLTEWQLADCAAATRLINKTETPYHRIVC